MHEEALLREIAALKRRVVHLETLEGVRVQLCLDNVSSPPTDAELDAAFGTPAALGPGFLGLVDDNNGHANVWLCGTIAASWWYVALTKAL